MRVVKLLALAATLGVAAESASAQEGALSRLYGNGIHAYFNGDIFGAEKLFTQAIDAGSQDPRCHYYRGLVYLQAGRDKAAAAEFEKGADLEAGATRAYDVSLALERIQGRSRLTLEQHRAAKLATATSATQVQRRQRLESIRRREPVTTVAPAPSTLDAITGDAAPIPATRLVPSNPVTAPAVTQPEVSAPFADPMEAAPAASTPAKAAAPVAAPVTEEADPFGADDALPADDMPAEVAAPADDAAPAADEAPADDEASDPFGGDEAPADDAAADEEMPAEDAAPAEEESDPFGADDAAPAAEDTAPAADDAAPAEEAADEADPFGGDDAAADDSSAAEAPADDAAPADEAPADEEDPFGS